MDNSWKYREILEEAIILNADVLYVDTEHPLALEILKIFTDSGFSYEIFYVEDQNVRINVTFRNNKSQ